MKDVEIRYSVQYWGSGSVEDRWITAKDRLPTLEDAELYIRTERIDKGYFGVPYRILKREVTVKSREVARYG